jgi:tRNA(fMet)-specific endonuclease VapC
VKYLLDTDHISFLQRRKGTEYAALAAKLGRHLPSDFVFCVISFHEQVLGAQAYLNRAVTPSDVLRGYTLFFEILGTYSASPVLPFDAVASATFTALINSRIRVATMDLRIASIALSQNLTLLTRNKRDFGRVPNLITEDWTV